MLGCTFNEYKDRFDENLAIYLEAYEDNTPLSFIKNQLEQYDVFLNELNKISNELKTYGEINANKRFLRSRFFEGLLNLDINTYNDIQIENKRLDFLDVYFLKLDSQKKNDENYDWFEARINYVKLKKYIVSAEKILKFINGKYQIFDQEERQIINLALGQQVAPSNFKSKISDGVESNGLETEARVETEESVFDAPIDPNLQKINKYLKPYSDFLLDEDYILLTNSLLAYFKNGYFPKINKKIMFKRINKKKIGWALNEIYTFCKTEYLSVEYLRFAHQNINLFKNNVFDETNFQESNIYKYFKSNPKK